MAPWGDGETLYEPLKVLRFIRSYFVLCLSFYFTPSHSNTHTHSVTPPFHKSACHGGDIACMQSRFIKRMALFFLFFSPSLPISPGYLTSLSWQLLHMTCLCQAPCISEVLFSSLAATDDDNKKASFVSSWPQLRNLSQVINEGITLVVKLLGRRIHSSFRCRISDPYL